MNSSRHTVDTKAFSGVKINRNDKIHMNSTICNEIYDSCNQFHSIYRQIKSWLHFAMSNSQYYLLFLTIEIKIKIQMNLFANGRTQFSFCFFFIFIETWKIPCSRFTLNVALFLRTQKWNWCFSPLTPQWRILTNCKVSTVSTSMALTRPFPKHFLREWSILSLSECHFFVMLISRDSVKWFFFSHWNENCHFSMRVSLSW